MPKMYVVHNVVRGRTNRTQRAQSPVHQRFAQRIGPSQLRLVRNRPLTLSEEEFTAALDEIREKCAMGIVEVRTEDGRLLNIDTLEPMEANALSPLPSPPIDSITRDQPWGQRVPPHGSMDFSDPSKKPELLKNAERGDEATAETQRELLEEQGIDDATIMDGDFTERHNEPDAPTDGSVPRGAGPDGMQAIFHKKNRKNR